MRLTFFLSINVYNPRIAKANKKKRAGKGMDKIKLTSTNTTCRSFQCRIFQKGLQMLGSCIIRWCTYRPIDGSYRPLMFQTSCTRICRPTTRRTGRFRTIAATTMRPREHCFTRVVCCCLAVSNNERFWVFLRSVLFCCFALSWFVVQNQTQLFGTVKNIMLRWNAILACK